MPLLQAEKIAAAAGKTLSSAALLDLQDDLNALQDEVEGYLHRVLERREFTVTKEVTYDGRINLSGPALVVSSVQLNSDTTKTIIWNYDTKYRDGIVVPVNQYPGHPLYDIKYTAGDEDAPPSVLKLMKDVAVRQLIAGPQVASGVIAGFSVEGTSIQYGAIAQAKSDSESKGSFTSSELKMLDRYRRRITR